MRRLTHLSACSVGGVDQLLVHGSTANGYDSCGLVDFHMINLFHVDQDPVLNPLQFRCVAMTSVLSQEIDVLGDCIFDLWKFSWCPGCESATRLCLQSLGHHFHTQAQLLP